jgi:transketolase
MALTRQGVAPARTTHTDENLCAKGAYVLSDCKGKVQATILATGSEVEIALAAQAQLAEEGIADARRVLPVLELFEQQHGNYRKSVLGNAPRVAVEAGVRFGWDRWIGEDGGFVGMDSFGASAPYTDLYKKFGITPQAVVAEVKKRIA